MTVFQRFRSGTLTPLLLKTDNQGAISLSLGDRFHARMKHINIQFHFIRYTVEKGKIVLGYCPTEDMLADPLTKGLPSAKVKHFASQMGLCSV